MASVTRSCKSEAWRRRELNPRPQSLHLQVYMLIQTKFLTKHNLIWRSHAQRVLFIQQVTLERCNLLSCVIDRLSYCTSTVSKREGYAATAQLSSYVSAFASTILQSSFTRLNCVLDMHHRVRVQRRSQCRPQLNSLPQGGIFFNYAYFSSLR